MTHETKVWFNPANGHQYEEGQRGSLLNGNPVDVIPDWVSGPPTYVFGTLSMWSGGDCPVPPASEVRCIFRGRRPYIGPAIWPQLPDSAKAVMWRHAPCRGRNNPASDILSFQVRIA